MSETIVRQDIASGIQSEVKSPGQVRGAKARKFVAVTWYDRLEPEGKQPDDASSTLQELKNKVARYPLTTRPPSRLFNNPARVLPYLQR